MKKNHLLKKSGVVGIVVIFICASFVSSIGGYSEEINQIDTEVADVCEPKENVLVTCHTFGFPGEPSQEITMSLSEAELLYDKIKDLQIEIAQDPLSEKIQQLQHEIIALADEYNLLPAGLSPETLKSRLIQSSRPQHPKITLPRLQNRASELFCNYVSTGSGTSFPIIILPRLIPILLTPIPRLFVRWSTMDGVTSCGGLRSGTGFIAYGAQNGIALGFWGIGFSIFLPPVMAYGLLGYALFASVNAEEIELWPPNRPPVISDENPPSGALDIPISLSESSFRIEDADGDHMSYNVRTDPDIGSGSGSLKPDGVYTVPVSGLKDLTEYSWHIEVTDGMDTTMDDFTFTTEANAPIVSNPAPKDGSWHTSVDLAHLSFSLKDYQGDLMDYTVETSPNIGSGSENGVVDGTYTVPINGLDFDTEYIWYVNVTDGTRWTYEEFHFKTRVEPGPWWDETWTYRKYLGIMDASSDYQIVLKVWKEDGHDDPENGNIDCEYHCNEDFSDIRFVTFDGVKCNYWIEKTGIDGGDHYAIIWVKTPSSGDEQLYFYYGNQDASDESSGVDTFIFFDDFEDNTLSPWIETCTGVGGEVSITSSEKYEGNYSMKIDGPTADNKWTRATYEQDFANSIRVNWYWKTTYNCPYWELYNTFQVSTNDDKRVRPYQWDSKVYYYDGSYKQSGLSFGAGWHNCEYRLIIGSNPVMLVDGSVSSSFKWHRNEAPGSSAYFNKLSAQEEWKNIGYVDLVRVGKYALVEPSWSVFGSEEPVT